MTQGQVLLIVLVVLVVANVFLIATMPLRMRRRRRPSASHPDIQTRPAAPDVRARPLASAGRTNTVATEDERVIAAIESFVTGADPDAAGRARPPESSDAMPRGRDPAIAAAPQLALADLGDAAMWSRAIREESARAARFGHPITVVVAELPRLDGLSDRFGRGIADRVTEEAAQWLASESRAVDRVAWLGGARFGVLLPETDEIAAGAWVERVRGVADDWLEATGLSIRLSLGWASPTEGGDVAAAAIAAEQRMHDAERRSRPSPTIISRVSRPPDFPRPPRRTSGG